VPPSGRCAAGRAARSLDVMTGDSVIQVRGLRKSYGTTTAIDGVDLDVTRGEVFALLGPNGAGKTTAVEILEGYRRRDGGTATVLSEDPAEAGRNRRWRARIGIVLQLTTEPELTVAEMVGQFASYYPRPRDPGEVIALVGLAGLEGRRAHQLSGGQQRRLDVALGIVGRPEVLFLDEPTTGFDPEARRQFWDLIRQLAGDGTTILLTTHYLQEAEALADRVGVLAAGKIVALGEPATLGGRAVADAQVSWDTPGGRRTVSTTEPAKAVVQLAAQYGDLPRLTVTRPSLEDIYLELIGASR
jgi:ABC-2 type transport system ATP-binding protein